ncbi:MAG: galactokinase [Oscillospiraceae bacterium]|nr:galactokinase [Oscillospiraceae bacterium]
MRFERLIEQFAERFGQRDMIFVSAPGRTEIGGNHTDHQHGCVLAAAVQLDCVFCAARNDENVIRIESGEYPPVFVDLNNLDAGSLANGSEKLAGGVAHYLRGLGHAVGGFDAFAHSEVLDGSGLSSSASFEVAVGRTFSALYNNNKISPLEMARAGQFAENHFLLKPSGLMDQLASASGGLVFIDFADPAAPIIKNLNTDLTCFGHKLCITDTKGSHAGLNSDYAGIPEEMHAVAEMFGAAVLRDVDESRVLANIRKIRDTLGDRALLRALHFFAENRRAREETEALERGDFAAFLSLVNQSGGSSFMYLQNAYSISNPQNQGIPIGLEASGRVLKGRGASRVHGGGFAGTIQAFVPDETAEEYRRTLDGIFGEGACQVLQVRAEGAALCSAAEYK